MSATAERVSVAPSVALQCVSLMWAPPHFSPCISRSDNYPLRGSKMTLWEGGVRGVSFITHGDPRFIPAKMRGNLWDGMAHGTDW